VREILVSLLKEMHRQMPFQILHGCAGEAKHRCTVDKGFLDIRSARIKGVLLYVKEFRHTGRLC